MLIPSYRPAAPPHLLHLPWLMTGDQRFNVLPLKSIDSPSDLPESKEEPILKDHAAPQQPGATSSRIQEESEIRLPNSRLSAVIGSLADSILLAGQRLSTVNQTKTDQRLDE